MNLNPKSIVSIGSLAAICLSASLNTGYAALLSSDSFVIGPGQYSVGNINGQNNSDPFYSGGWVTTADNNVNIVANGLSYGNLQTSGGAVATDSTGRAGRYLATPWGNSTVGTFYVSFLASFGTTNGAGFPGDAVNHRVVEAWNGTIGNDGQRSLQLGYSSFTGLGANLSVNVNNGAGGLETDLDPVTNIGTDNGASHLFVLRLDLSDVAGGDVLWVYQDPTDLSTEPGSPNGLLSGFDFGLTAMGSVVEFIFPGNPPGTTGYFDEERFGTTYADVLPQIIPEPTTFSLVGLGALGLAIVRRKKV